MASMAYLIKTKCLPFSPVYKGPSEDTKKQYLEHTIKFAQWAKIEFNCKTYESLIENIEDKLNAYVEYLETQEKPKSPATIHTYIAACCYAFNIPMAEIHKPNRHCYEAIRSRGEKAVDRRTDATREVSPRLYDFAECVGVRRDEYHHLHKNHFLTDESGYFCVDIKKGKGGKRQLQRILPEHIDFVKGFFDGSTDFVFTLEEMNNKIDLHHIRADVAKKAYAYYLHRIESEHGYREKLEQEIQARWELYRGTPPPGSKKKYDWTWDVSRVRGMYYIRGGNRQKAIENGFPIAYDRLATMAVSVFHLSHWRCDVTIDNYLLAK